MEGRDVDSARITLITALVGSAIVVLGWFVTNYYTVKRETAAREVATRLKFLERQIEEFYGPLFSLTRQIEDAQEVRRKLVRSTVFLIREGRLKDSEGHSEGYVTDEDLETVTDADMEKFRDTERVNIIRFWTLENVIYPLFDEANNILTTRLHLIEQAKLPKSYKEFVQHIVQNKIQNKLYNQMKVPTRQIVPPPYPEAFKSEVESTLERLMLEYRALQGRATGGSTIAAFKA
jgi:hypothetical protein